MIDSFLANQAKIYDGFETDQALAIRQGLARDPVLTGRRGGYLAALRPSQVILQELSSLTSRIKAEIEGVVVYGMEDFHTTISSFGIADGFNPRTDPQRDRVMSALEAAKHAAEEYMPIAICAYSTIVFNRTTLILQGTPGVGFLTISDAFVRRARVLGIKLKMPWGAHITLARFGRENPPTDAVRLARICDEHQGRLSREPHWFQSLQIGWFTSSPDAFDVTFSS